MSPIPEWQNRAACQTSHPDLFFPAAFESTRPAKAICATCPVNVECLEFALDENMQHGIWGGTTLKERRQIRSRRHVGAA